MAFLTRRRSGLLAIAAVLAVLQAPLCALACLPAASSAAPPCHAPAEGAPPADPAAPHDDCGGCETGAALLSAAEATSLPATAAFAGPTSIDPRTVPGRAAARSRAPTDLPPPEIPLHTRVLRL